MADEVQLKFGADKPPPPVIGRAIARHGSSEGEMANNNRGWGWWGAVASAAVLGISAATAPPASAQDTGTRIRVDAAKSVDLRTAPETPSVPPPAGLFINRPTIPMADYLAAK